ncbi:Uncharacterised protein [Vibrio cholerae]|nr:Uncharacterised protein [Vibrio cholerae]CSI75936.1 Uncharacterised protein [Vibrio cholerae]
MASHGNGSVIANHLRSDHSHGFRDHRVNFSRHDRGARL